MSSYLTVIDPSSPCTDMPTDLSCDVKFALDPFQQHAVKAIHAGRNVLVTAKTGSGKTFVGEYQIAHSLRQGGRVFYTTPIKSLSNQKFHDLKQLYPGQGQVGIMTGDIKFCPDAPIVIMTTEILRNLLFKQGTSTAHLGITAGMSLEGLDAVVFDECHYINDRDRGAVWEETLILLPPAVHLVLLSATIDAPEFFAGWLGDLKKVPIDLISTSYRIVPLQHGVFRGNELLTVMDNKERFDTGIYRAWLGHATAATKAADQHRAAVADRRRGGYEDPVVRRAAGPKAFKHQMNELIATLDERELLPALFFVFSRKGCERYAAAVEHTLIDSSDAAAVKHIVEFHLHKYFAADKGGLDKSPEYHNLLALLQKGVAYHHSGLLPVLKEIVEILFGRGLIKLLFATETFAVGINMPTKTVVFTGYRKYDDAVQGLRMLNTDEYIQMAGRAGRRGKDDKGLVLYLPDREPESADDVKRMMTGARQTFQSRMTFHYDFLLKTIQNGTNTWLDIMHQSYWFRRHALTLERAKKDLATASVAVPALTEKEQAEMEEHDRLQAELKISVNAARKKAQAAWSTWDNSHVGPRWHDLKKTVWPAAKRAAADLAALRRDIEAAETPEADVMPSLEALRQIGFLEDCSSAGSCTGSCTGSSAAFKLTGLGEMATEVNEGHGILMPLLYRNRAVWDSMSPAELLATLAGFFIDGKEDETPSIDSLAVPSAVRDALRWVGAEGRRCQATEDVARAPPPPKATFWELRPDWVEPVWRWLSNPEETLVGLAADYGIYAGNMTRVLLKVSNLLEEWRSLAELNAHVDVLDRLRDVDGVLLRGLALGESLYLKKL